MSGDVLAVKKLLVRGDTKSIVEEYEFLKGFQSHYIVRCYDFLDMGEEAWVVFSCGY